MGVFVMISNYFHDLAVALLAVSVAAVFAIGKYLKNGGEASALSRNLLRTFSRITWLSLVYVVLGGALRAWFYMDYEWNPAVGRSQVAALVVKHVILVGMTIWGVAGQFYIIRKYGR